MRQTGGGRKNVAGPKKEKILVHSSLDFLQKVSLDAMKRGKGKDEKYLKACTR